MFKLLPDSSNDSLPQTIDNVTQVTEILEPEDKIYNTSKIHKIKS